MNKHNTAAAAFPTDPTTTGETHPLRAWPAVLQNVNNCIFFSVVNRLLSDLHNVWSILSLEIKSWIAWSSTVTLLTHQLKLIPRLARASCARWVYSEAHYITLNPLTLTIPQQNAQITPKSNTSNTHTLNMQSKSTEQRSNAPSKRQNNTQGSHLHPKPRHLTPSHSVSSPNLTKDPKNAPSKKQTTTITLNSTSNLGISNSHTLKVNPKPHRRTPVTPTKNQTPPENHPKPQCLPSSPTTEDPKTHSPRTTHHLNI